MHRREFLKASLPIALALSQCGRGNKATTPKQEKSKFYYESAESFKDYLENYLKEILVKKGYTDFSTLKITIQEDEKTTRLDNDGETVTTLNFTIKIYVDKKAFQIDLGIDQRPDHGMLFEERHMALCVEHGVNHYKYMMKLRQQER